MKIPVRFQFNSGLAKVAVQWLNEALCPAVYMRDFVVADSCVLRNRQLLVAAKRCA